MLSEIVKLKVAARAVEFVVLSTAPNLVDQTVTVETLRQLVAAFNSHDSDRVMSFWAE